MTETLANENRKTHVWPLVAEYLNFSDVLHLRVTCPSVAISLSRDVSPEVCMRWLDGILKRKNLFLMEGRDVEASWYMSQRESPSYFLMKRQQRQSPFELLLKTIWASSRIPYAAAVAYNGKFGRHVVCLDANSMPIQYPACDLGKRKCQGCCFKIPPRTSTSQTDMSIDYDTDEAENIEYTTSDEPRLHDMHQIHARRNGSVKTLDLERFYLKCIPNLPPRTICPVCCSAQRTLLLSIVSYRTTDETVRQDQSKMSFTFTPMIPDESTCLPIDTRFFIPGCSRGPDCSGEFKHAICLHCASCKQFGMLSPARSKPTILHLSNAEFGGMVIRKCALR